MTTQKLSDEELDDWLDCTQIYGWLDIQSKELASILTELRASRKAKAKVREALEAVAKGLLPDGSHVEGAVAEYAFDLLADPDVRAFLGDT